MHSITKSLMLVKQIHYKIKIYCNNVFAEAVLSGFTLHNIIEVGIFQVTKSIYYQRFSLMGAQFGKQLVYIKKKEVFRVLLLFLLVVCVW